LQSPLLSARKNLSSTKKWNSSILCNKVQVPSKETELENWKRRKNYDPMKAAAQGKKKDQNKQTSYPREYAIYFGFHFLYLPNCLFHFILEKVLIVLVIQYSDLRHSTAEMYFPKKMIVMVGNKRVYIYFNPLMIGTSYLNRLQ